MFARLIAVAVTLAAAPAFAADLKVLTTGAFKPVAADIIAQHERASGDKVTLANDTAGGLTRRLDAGEDFDVVILTPGGVDDFIRKGKIAQGTKVELARVAIGVAVKDGAPKPDISSVEKFRAALTAARKIAYIDPASGGSSGIYLAGLFDKWGVADAIKAKAVLVPGGLVAEKLVNGEADLALHQISEILAVKGATLVGPLPAEIQNYTVYAGGISATTKQADAAKKLLAALHGEGAQAVLKGKGMEAVGR